jgi:hypothetical protein
MKNYNVYFNEELKYIPTAGYLSKISQIHQDLYMHVLAY